MAYYDPLSSLSIAPTAAQLQYREEVPERVSTFVSDLVPSASALAKDIGGAFKHAFVGDSYDEPFQSSTGSSSKIAFNVGQTQSDADDSNPLADLLSPTSTPSGSRKVQAKPIMYSDWSDAARYFGMDQSTAYAEHMANTAYQREVADLRAAGLNPVLGLGSGASGVTGHVAASGGFSSGRKASDSDGLVDTIGATVGFLASLVAGDSAGRFASKAATGIGKLLSGK